jgi:hypothetical protein
MRDLDAMDGRRQRTGTAGLASTLFTVDPANQRITAAPAGIQKP